jgi:chromosome segregation ATPase
MTTLIGQMLGCLLVAAGIGCAVGWLLRHFSSGSRQSQGTGGISSLRLNSQALEKLQQELNVKISATQALENKMIASDALRQSTEQELAAQHEQVRVLRKELAAMRQLLLEQETARDSWIDTYAQVVQRATDEAARSQNLRTQVDELRARLTLQEQGLSQKDQHLAEQTTRAAEKEAEIDRLRKRLIEVQAALRIRAEGGSAPRQIQPTGNQLSLQIGQTNPSTAPPTDGLPN